MPQSDYEIYPIEKPRTKAGLIFETVVLSIWLVIQIVIFTIAVFIPIGVIVWFVWLVFS